MKLKVVKYKNYGCMMESEETEDPYDNRFFWCFFALNNGKIINKPNKFNLTMKI